MTEVSALCYHQKLYCLFGTQKMHDFLTAMRPDWNGTYTLPRKSKMVPAQEFLPVSLSPVSLE